MDEMNEMSSQENDTNGLDSLSKIHAIFLALKPIDPAFLKRLSSIKGNA
jgi:hypothetical protein